MNIKNIIMTFAFVLLLAGFMVINIITPDKERSEDERRPLEQLPSFSVDSVLEGKYFDKLDDYVMDQFVGRDLFRSFNAYVNYYLLGQRDNNGIYTVGDGIYKTEYPLNQSAINAAAKRFEYLKNKYFPNCNTYFTIVPDKNYYVAKDKGYLSLDYDKIVELMKIGTPNIDYIDIFPHLAIEDYYNTDLHWDGTKIIDVADVILQAMGCSGLASDQQFTTETAGDFYGGYYGQSALLHIKPDLMTYLTNSIIQNATVFDFEAQKDISVYAPNKFQGIDPYDIFLSGARAVLTINNSANTSGKELVIFRDSFGSSIAPLLISEYSKITLVDLRYITASMLPYAVDFDNNPDVLFLYNTVILNNSSMIIRD